jgi:hypothetical protein
MPRIFHIKTNFSEAGTAHDSMVNAFDGLTAPLTLTVRLPAIIPGAALK